MFMLKVITFLTYILTGTFAGCRWYNPAWLQNLDSAPQVDISTDKMVNVGWSNRKFKKKFDCADKFEVWIENNDEERRLCSIVKHNG